MTRIKFDKKAKMIYLTAVTLLSEYEVSFPFNKVAEVNILINKDLKGNEARVAEHCIRTTDNKTYRFFDMSLSQAKEVHHRIKEILGLSDADKKSS